MLSRHYPSTAFLLTGFSWLVLSSILGLAILIGLVRSTPLPPWVRLVHVHGALIGGIAQMLLGGFLAFSPSSSEVDDHPRKLHPVLLLAVNLGTVGMLIGFWLHQSMVVSGAGLAVAIAFLWMAGQAWKEVRRSDRLSTMAPWYYLFTVVALAAGLVCGEAMSLGLLQQSHGYVRLAHIHLLLLGFVTLTLIATIHRLLPAALNTVLFSTRLAHLSHILMLIGVAILIVGFLNSSVPAEMAAGAVFLAGGILYAINLFQTWAASSHKSSAASDHFLVGTFFLLCTIVVGALVGLNSLSNPPVMPYGTLHLIAYTHLTFAGFMLQTIMGALSHVIPLSLAASRIPNHKNRGPYLEQLAEIADRWRPLQVGGVSLGTMGLAVLASLTWNVPLTSLYIKIAMWTCFTLLLVSLVYFCSKLAHLYVTWPPE